MAKWGASAEGIGNAALMWSKAQFDQTLMQIVSNNHGVVDYAKASPLIGESVAIDG